MLADKLLWLVDKTMAERCSPRPSAAATLLLWATTRGLTRTGEFMENDL